MLHRLTAIPLLLWSQVCAAHGDAASAGHGLTGPLLGNIIVVTLGGIITIACIFLALRMVFRPGELDPEHPKRRILQPDR
jgi:hypothetical protein